MIADKLNIAPYMAKGRWYHALVESNGSALHLTTCDLEDCNISSTYLQFPHGFRVVDHKLDMHASGGTSTTATNIAINQRRMGDGKMAITLPAASLADYTDVYFYGYFEQ